MAKLKMNDRCNVICSLEYAMAEIQDRLSDDLTDVELVDLVVEVENFIEWAKESYEYIYEE